MEFNLGLPPDRPVAICSAAPAALPHLPVMVQSTLALRNQSSYHTQTVEPMFWPRTFAASRLQQMRSRKCSASLRVWHLDQSRQRNRNGNSSDMTNPPNQGAAANLRLAGQLGGSINLSAIDATERAFPAAVVELARQLSQMIPSIMPPWGNEPT